MTARENGKNRCGHVSGREVKHSGVFQYDLRVMLPSSDSRITFVFEKRSNKDFPFLRKAALLRIEHFMSISMID